MTKINLLHFNARSLLPKLDNLKLECIVSNPHIVCISETWLDSTITDNELTINNYNLVRLDRNRHGGGIAVYVHVDFTYHAIFTGNCNFECIVLSITINLCKLCICLLYRPPSSSFEVLNSLHDVLCNLDVSLFSHFILVGDFNVDFLSPNRPLYHKLLSITSCFLLQQVVTEPTHFSHLGTPSIIDLFFVSNPTHLISCSTVSPLSTSDHLGILLTYKLPTTNKRPRSCRRTVWCYSQGDYEKACELLDRVDWDQLMDEPDVDQCWQSWQSTYLNIISKCIPKKVLSSRRNLPWINPSICQAIKRRNSLFKAYKRSSSSFKLLQYKFIRNRIVSEVRKAKLEFFKRLQTVDAKTFWKLFILLTRKESSIPALLGPNSTLVTNDVQKADILNNQFFSNFNHCICNIGLLDSSNFPEEFLCTDEQVFDLIHSLDSTKATGADGISTRMLKATATCISKSLSDLFNKSLITGTLPTAWKFARVVPIPKSGSSKDSANYRPISILTVISKLLEKHIHNLLLLHLNSVSPLSQHQWGFTAGRSTTTALLSFTHNCQAALDSGDEVCSVFFDLCKAFDKVPHLPLLQKLADLQVNPCILRWIGSYLLDRSQAVVLGGVQSSPLHVISGVPQGSVLGPLLFLVYIDKVTNSVSHSNITMYADDIALWKIIRNPRDYTMLQDDIITICNWVADNHLVLNLTKCCYIVFSRKRLPTMPTTDLSVGDTHSLTRAHHHKYLGVTLTSDLSWSLHITNICKKTRKQTGLLYRNFYRFADPSIMLKLYTSLVRPHTEYASITWDPHHLSKDILALENTQKFALSVCLKNWRADYDLLLDQAHLPRLSSRRKFLKLCLLYNIFTGKVIYHDSPLVRWSSPYPNRLQNSLQLSPLYARTDYFKYSFFPSSIEAWNSLHFDVASKNTLLSFKHALRN